MFTHMNYPGIHMLFFFKCIYLLEKRSGDERKRKRQSFNIKKARNLGF